MAKQNFMNQNRDVNTHVQRGQRYKRIMGTTSAHRKCLSLHEIKNYPCVKFSKDMTSQQIRIEYEYFSTFPSVLINNSQSSASLKLCQRNTACFKKGRHILKAGSALQNEQFLYD